MSAVRTPGTWVATEKRATDGSSVTCALYAGDVHIGSVSLPTSGRMYVPDYYKVREANAAFIVRACNNHDALVKALQAAMPFIGYDGVDCADIKDAARAALTAAGAA